MTNDAPSDTEVLRGAGGILSIFFSVRGRITRAECMLAGVTWFFAIVFGAFAIQIAGAFGYRWAIWLYGGAIVVACASFHAIQVQRMHDVGRGNWSWLLNPLALWQPGMVVPNDYGPPAPPRRVWWLLGAIAVLAVVAYSAATYGVGRYADAYCAPSVSASAATKSDAAQRWREAVSTQHGADYLSGNTVGHNTTCRNNECTVSGRACRRLEIQKTP